MSTVSSPRALRLWPGVVIVALQWLGRFVVPRMFPDHASIGILAGIAGGLAILIWWLFFSRAPWIERVGAVVLIVGAVWGTRWLVHPSIANGMMGMMLPIYALPLLALALVAWAAASRAFSPAGRGASLLAAIGLACAVMLVFRTGGLSGDGVADLHWRWTQTPEERLLAGARPAESGNSGAAANAGAMRDESRSAATPRVAEVWPGFRGPQRDGVVRGVKIVADWTRSPPVELWRRPVGPGWSSFAVVGDLVYTQEQRGEQELVSCYRLSSGARVWTHADPVRFWESNAGAGPRGTPTVTGGRVYAFGATGVLNALDARDGRVVWTRQAASDTGRKVPEWGFASSPVVVGDTVLIATAGVLAAYDAATGAPRWTGPKGGGGYSSPHVATLAGVEQVLLSNGTGTRSFSPRDGQVLWEHAWKIDGIVQPAVLTGGDVLIGSGSGLGAKVGVRRVAVARGADGWTTDERWTSIGLKPYFNDFVVHRDHAYGIDGNTLACITLADGARAWKGGRYGHGQLLLLADQDVLLVLSEDGDVALVQAKPDAFTELARSPALKGKTWNHPVLAHDVLLVRNSEEMAAFRLALVQP